MKFQVTYGKDDRPKLHKHGCADVRKWELANRPAWDLTAVDLRAAMWQAGEEQRQVNNDPSDMDEDPGVDLMGCVKR